MPVRFLANRIKRFFIYRVLSLNDTPHRIALGVGIGILITWTPTIGLQMVLTIALSTLLRANKFVGVPFVWISNPFTLIPIYGPNYLIGAWLIGGRYSFSEFSEAVTRAYHADGGFFHRIHSWAVAIWPVFVPLWVGSIIVGLVLGAVAYVGVYWAVVAFRRRRHKVHPELYAAEGAVDGKVETKEAGGGKD